MKCTAMMVALLGSVAAHADTLRLALPAFPGGPTYAKTLARAVSSAQHGVILRIVPLPNTQVPAAPPWDIAQLDPVRLAQACASGAIAKTDVSHSGSPGRFLPRAVSECGVGAFFYSMVLSWDTAKVPGAPHWSDFWNVARAPGQRGLRRGPIGTLEIALMADGVAPGDVYTMLRARDGVERAFRKLDQLRPYIAWWRDDAEPAALLAAGRVLMTSAPDERIAEANRRLHRSFAVQWDGGIAMVQSWAISASTQHAAAATALIAAVSEPAAQAQLTGRNGLGAAVPADPKTLDPAVAAVSPSAHLDHAVPFDAGFWRDNEATLTAKFEAWLKH